MRRLISINYVSDNNMISNWFLDMASNSGKFEIYDCKSRYAILNNVSFYWSSECGYHHHVHTFVYGVWYQYQRYWKTEIEIIKLRSKTIPSQH